MAKVAKTQPNAFKHTPITSLNPARANVRTHSKKQIKTIAASISEFGFVNPVLVDESGNVLAGHGRLEAARHLELTCVPTLRIDHLSEAQKRAYIIADNRIAELAGWDKEILAIELEGLIELDFPVEPIGFEPPEIDLLLADHGEDRGADPPEDRFGEPDRSRPAITRPGDVWQLGKHRLLCGDARQGDHYSILLGADRAQAVITDPPYNVPVRGHVCGSGRHREFAMASGEMSSPQFSGFLSDVFAQLKAVSQDGALHYVFMDWRHLSEVMDAGRRTYEELVNLVVWDKQSPGMGSFYRSQHEFVLVFQATAGKHLNLVELGRHGRNRSNVWSYRGLAGFGRGRSEALEWHPTVKPVAMIADALLDCTRRGELVLDPFCGSGTILIAAQKTNRQARAMEIDPHYCDVAIRCWQGFTGQSAIHCVTGHAFDEANDRKVA